jgi:hypothetical protein
MIVGSMLGLDVGARVLPARVSLAKVSLAKVSLDSPEPDCDRQSKYNRF